MRGKNCSGQSNAPARSLFQSHESHDLLSRGALSRDQPRIHHDALPQPCDTALRCVQPKPPTTHKGRSIRKEV